MLSKNKLLFNIIRYRAVFTLIYEFLLLLIFYLITKFHFKNNTSLLLLFLILIVPIVLSILSHLLKKENKQKYLNSKTSYDTLIKKDYESGKFEKEFISKLSKIVPNVKPRYSDKEIMITCGIKNNITIMFNEQKTIVFIDNTNIIYQYIYGYKDDDVTKYDHKGISKIPTERFYNLLIKRISDLVDKEYQYIEYYQGNDYNGCLLKHNDKEIYNIVINEKKNIFKRNKSKKRIINT